MLDDQQSRLGVFNYETETLNRARRAPRAQLAVKLPNPEMKIGTLDRRRELHQHAGGQRQRAVEDQRLARIFMRKILERGLGTAAFLGTKAGAKRGVFHRGDLSCLWLRRDLLFAVDVWFP